MTDAQATQAALRRRLLPQPRELRRLAGELEWYGQPFALQLQGAFTASQHQSLLRVLASFLPGPDADASHSQFQELSLRVICEGRTPNLACAPGVSDTDALHSEAYELEITQEGIVLSASTSLGVSRGMHTLAQILVYALGQTPSHGPTLEPGRIPCLHIIDQPAFAWRGVLLDVARHFIELPALIRTLEGMAHHKLNVLHLHLTDDQAFRFPSTAYPKLNQFGPTYSKAELNALVAHAQRLGIRIVPELDIPGHTTCWLAAYPEWALYEVSPSDRFGVHQGCLNPCREQTYQVIATLLDEFAEVFADPCVHIGGDEVHPRWWQEHPEVQAYMAQHQLDAPRDLQAHFNRRVCELIESRGKRMLAWDEAVHELLPKSVVVQAWRGMTARDAAVARGHDCIVSSPYYLDLFYPADLHTRFAPLQATQEALANEDALPRDVRLSHVAGGLEWTLQWRERAEDLAAGDHSAPVLASNVQGAEACLWSELVDTQTLDVRLWSRLPLLAELFWLGQTRESAYTRIAHSLYSWQRLGGPEFGWCLADAGSPLTKSQLALLAPSGITETVSQLLGVLEPSKWYARLLGAEALAARLQGSEMPKARPYNRLTELRSIACVISPQSFRSAEFEELLLRWNQAALSDADQAQLKFWLACWAGQLDAVQQLSVDADVLEQLRALAGRLFELTQVLDYLLKSTAQGRYDQQAADALEKNFLTSGGGRAAGYKSLRAALVDWATPLGELMLAPAVVLLRAQDALLDTADVQHALTGWFDEMPLTCVAFGEGHINSTWRVTTESGDEFVLQRLSTSVFADPQRLASNQASLLKVARQAPGFDYQLPEPMAARDGSLLLEQISPTTGAMSFWRLCRLITNSRTQQRLVNPAQARAAGEAFGAFQKMARLLAPATLAPAIDGFLELDGYWHALSQQVSNMSGEELAETDPGAHRVWVRLCAGMQKFLGKSREAAVVIHGDCKLNNVLFAQGTDQVCAILDLDTLMVGPWWLDFGDLVRSAAVDESGEFVEAYYAGLAQGFFAGSAELDNEFSDTYRDAALAAPAHLAFMLAVRFLDDHLGGDSYFRVEQHGDNLRRAEDTLDTFEVFETPAVIDFMRATLDAVLAGAQDSADD